MNKTSNESIVLLSSVFVVGLCTIVYELLIGSVSAYFMGDSIRQFSITIGLSMTAMGIGTFVSRIIKKNLLTWFILVEVLLGIVGGLSVPILFLVFALTNFYYYSMILLIVVIGIFIGLEIPLLTRIMEKHYVLKINISNVLSLDYLGALAASLLFPFFLLPFFGLFKSSLITGIINLIVGFVILIRFNSILKIKSKQIFITLLAGFLLLLSGMYGFSSFLVTKWESSIYNDKVIFSKQTKYQKIVLTKNKDDLRMFINGNLQFASVDEYRYHEALVHPALLSVKNHNNILILGGGDGLAVRELLKYDNIQKITLVDIDPEMTELCKSHKFISKLNLNSLINNKVTIINNDAFKFLEENADFFDIIIADLPDPNNISLAKLYSREFYSLLRKRLSKTGVFVTQATSPFFSLDSFWCINSSIKDAGFQFTIPYHAYVPSFGDWGFIFASNIKYDIEKIEFNIQTKFLNKKLLKNLIVFPKDQIIDDEIISTLNKPKVLELYLKGWKNWS